MKLTAVALLGFALLLLINLNACSVESRRIGHHPPGQGHHPPGTGHHNDHGGDGGHNHKHKHHHHHHAYDGYSFYVFGDSFADNGNLPHWDDNWPALSRQWYRPYGGDGRFSNQMVQSDFIANMLGQSEAPPAHALGTHAGKTGMNFAVGGSGVFKVRQQKPTLSMQIDSFFSLIQAGSIEREQLEAKSVALVAVSGNDYDRVGVDTSDFGRIRKYVDNVTSEIAANVARLQDLGVQKVLVNNLHPLGCAPSQSRPRNYTVCDPQGNQGASLHNRFLSDKLADLDGVLVLDLSTAFTQIIHRDAHSDPPEASQDFVHKLKPCCVSFETDGYCGLVTRDMSFDPPLDITRYQVCDDVDSHFYFDDMHPTQAGWTAVMGQVESAIKEFLEIE